jgi:P-loop containing NTP hydrolase pore-1/C-terminal domain on Strawberry notch homologue
MFRPEVPEGDSKVTANNETNPARDAAATAPPPGATTWQPRRFAHALPQGTDALVLELKERLATGERFNNPRLAEIANEILGGTRAEGTFSTRDMYDAAEAAANLLLLERDARLVLEMNDPKRALESTLRPLLAQLPRQSERDHEQITHQQFSTPPPLAYVVFWASGARPADVVIESCAGTGSLAVWPRAAGIEVITNELSERRCALLELLGFSPTQYDAELIHEPEFIGVSAEAVVRPSLALGNPPWSATAGRVERNSTAYGANHVTSNLRRLAEDGRLVALVGGGMALDRPHFSGWWRRVVTRYNVRANVSVPGSEFARYGTTYDCQIIVIDKTGPTPGATLREQLASVVHGRAHSLEHLFDLLDGVRSSRPACVPTRGYEEAAGGEELEVVNLDAGGETARPEPAWGAFYRAPRPSGESPDAAQDAAAEPDRLDALEFLGDAPAADEPAAEEAGEEEQRPPAADGRRAARRAEDVYVPYVTRKLTGGAEHPAQMVEAATMAAVDPPDITYFPCLQPEIISEGRLSRIQLERVIYAGQRHEQRLFHGERGGFFIGDGTGSGKGRDLAAIGVDNWNQGRRRILWLSVNNDLIESARRDIHDLGVELPLAQLNNFHVNDDIPLKEGVVFCTYPTLISKSRTGRTRFDQLVRWLGPEGVVFFDECHKAKNVLSTGNGHPTQTGKAVVKLQDAHERPDLRVVYSSATGAQDVRNLAYAVRLGLWGEGTPFADFKDFMKKIEEGGIGAMEMCCRDMKALGMYLAASLSYGVDPQSGLAVEYREVPHELTPQQREMYNAAAAAWLYVLNSCREANEMANGGERQIKSALQGYWGKHQRFFRLVIAAFKIPTVIAAAERALEEGRSPIISLIGTGEARTKEQVALAVAEGSDLEDLDFTPREVIAEAVMSCLPTQLYQDKEEDGEIVKVAVTNEDGEPVQCQEALELRRQVLESLTLLDLPDNPLDTLVNHFGPKNVAEITGRKKRLIRRDDGRVEYVKRAPAGVATTKVNVYEQEAFQNGNHLDRYKTSAIISEAGSTGISLHASNRATNRRRREMIIIEYAWSADKQLQIMGRAHRTDQAYPPIFTSVPTDLGGERRFSSTIAMRLGSLGALTRGDRAAVDGGNLSKYNYETEHGKAALALLYSRILTIDDLGIPGLPDPRQTLELVGLITRTKDDTLTVRTEDMTHVPRFLNRVLALDVDRQNALFNEFDRLFRETVAQAKANGTFDEGVTDLRARSVRITRPPRVVHVDRTTGARTTHYSLEVDFPTETVTFARALEIKDERDGVFLQNKHTGRFALATRAGRRTDAETGRVSHTFCLTTPRWEKATYLGEGDLVEKYRPSYDDEARDWWTVAEALLPEVETCPLHVISGALLPLWERLAEGHDSMLSVIRVVTDDGLRIVGAEIPAALIARALTALGIAHNIEDTPDVFKAVLEGGRTIHLAAHMRLKRTLVNRERTIELLGVNPVRFEELRQLGLINRQIRFKERFFIPVDEDEGVHVLNRLLERYPRVDEEATEAAAARVEESADYGAFDLTPKVFDLEELVRHPHVLLPAAPPQHGLFGGVAARAGEAPPSGVGADAQEAVAEQPAPQGPAAPDSPAAEPAAEFASDLRPRGMSLEDAAALLKAQQLKQRRKPKKKGGGGDSAQGSFF